jgi:ATP synthase F1 delta subunit
MLGQLIIIQISTIIALIFLLRLFFYRNLNYALKRLKKLQEEALIKEAHLQEELERAKRERQIEIEKGKREAERLIEEAKKKAEHLRNSLAEKARQESKKILEQGEIELEKLRKELDEEIEKRALSISLEMIKYAFTEKGKENLQHKLIEEVLEEIKKLEKERFSVKENKVKIISSIPLQEKEKEELKNILSEKIGSDVYIKEEVNPEIIAGLIIEIGEFVIDGSLKNKLQKIASLLQK